MTIKIIMGNSGVGKTHWIKEDLKNRISNNQEYYFASPKTDSFPLDGAFLQTFYPQLSIVNSEDIQQLVNLGKDYHLYLEIPEYIEIENYSALFASCPTEKIAIIDSSDKQAQWQSLADQTIVNAVHQNNLDTIDFSSLQIQRIGLVEEILDFASLETFWQELIQGAYGRINRIKAIFNLFDGQCIYGDYQEQQANRDFQALNLPLSLEGRPTHFSGLEIIGQNLQKQTIVDTIGQFCLPDDIVNFYQQQVKAELEIMQ